MVRLRAIEPFTVEAIELAYRFAHGVPEHDLQEWLQSLPDAGARLLAIEDLLDDDALHQHYSSPEHQRSLRVANEVVRTLLLLCRDREKSIEEMVEEMMRADPVGAEP
ncbi:hypothetical protein AOA14_10700 [Sphingopyxis terrae subsp. terrae NBRC 15098]|uniref:Uncharacterized protein n=1 Tax=Sphingopyxis terrae subsp. terrae NBRC 15098 TaxID=1219058 RepID=A0A142VZ37_9SPHN|nr:hypothetical protein [Sphingopyxis terrae]AMU95073.1 hypothetical protein AOA14_10700 [Sphingopyxis terrae subsp. terrae NBRC 15098]